jgi:septum formation protein
MHPIVLASGSPRRRDLMRAAGFAVEIVKPEADETWPGGDARVAALTIAKRKLQKVVLPQQTVLAADTVVMLGEEPLGKPSDRAHAIAMITALSGREHQVITGYCWQKGERWVGDSVVSRVWFRPLSQADIERYIDLGESYDKAGAYAIQGIGGVIVDRVEGSFTNIMGLPITEVLASWQKL